MKSIIVAIAAVCILSGCYRGMPTATAGKVQAACAELGLVSTISSGGKDGEVYSVTCSAEGGGATH